uniref:Uncharacterized protein n=1 Tax=Meloidogyne hapla TaxID=6305 RepID=A0A1I8AXB9_MELHA
MDEAQLQLAEEKDYSKDFEEDLQGNEHGDIYDEHLAQLPEFEVHKLGKNMGWTKLPIVTRKKPLWSTPLPRTRPFSHSWAWLYTKPPTAVTQRTTTLTPLILSTPEVTNKEQKIEKSVISDKNVEKKEEKIKEINEGTIKNTTPRKMTNETNLITKSLETTLIREREQQINKITTKTIKIEKEKFETTQTTTTFSTNKIAVEKEEKENVLERLRKLLRNANLKGVFPSENHKVVVEVRSNVIAIKPAVDSKNVESSQSGGFAWPRTWDNEPDDNLAIRSWAREHSRQPEHQLLLPLQNNSNEKEELMSTPEQHSNFTQSSILSTTTTKIPPTIRTTSKAPTTPRKKGVVKPTFFNSGTYRHSGPTFNCRVLDAAVDGIPSENNDQTCPLDFPGIASDKSCKCTYEVSGRDEEGCATGFIYTCLRTIKSSNNELKS